MTLLLIIIAVAVVITNIVQAIRMFKARKEIEDIQSSAPGCVSCDECGVMIWKHKAQEVSDWSADDLDVYYCDRHRKPYDEISRDGKYYRNQVEVTKTGKII